VRTEWRRLGYGFEQRLAQGKDDQLVLLIGALEASQALPAMSDHPVGYWGETVYLPDYASDLAIPFGAPWAKPG
jgi:hypothetical protein